MTYDMWKTTPPPFGENTTWTDECGCVWEFEQGFRFLVDACRECKCEQEHREEREVEEKERTENEEENGVGVEDDIPF